jgi:muramoyltetrapeptide carboxypeptidase LdcA involved in peptidoglycan recycling
MDRMGLQVSYGAHAACISDDGASAGSPQQRAADFMDAFTDPSVDVVLSAFGGNTTHELLPLLDTDRLRAESKPFIGNSDNAWLHQYLFQEVGLTSYFGATYVGEIGGFGGPFPETLESFQRALLSAGDLVCLPMARRTSEFRTLSRREVEGQRRVLNLDGGWHWVRSGRGRGPLLGAEIGLLTAMAAHFNLKLDGCVVFWDVGIFSTEDVRDQLANLADRVSLDRLAGMMVGPDVRYTMDAWADAVADALSSVAPAANYPVVVNADVGHLDPKWTVPYGRDVVLDSSQGVVFPQVSRADRIDRV